MLLPSMKAFIAWCKGFLMRPMKESVLSGVLQMTVKTLGIKGLSYPMEIIPKVPVTKRAWAWAFYRVDPRTES
ncbi:Hypothetical protein CINCED_3A015545 [Cinara cedri]|uniref:Uncharacterized protein n=1 Tax=Cinara cedri TaxID=506608 RepID=A0A5E4M9L4_9HEMI|nr:Hypothetical protein CINCED_3A015545 [Cinara cedri]